MEAPPYVPHPTPAENDCSIFCIYNKTSDWTSGQFCSRGNPVAFKLFRFVWRQTRIFLLWHFSFSPDLGTSGTEQNSFWNSGEGCSYVKLCSPKTDRFIILLPKSPVTGTRVLVFAVVSQSRYTICRLQKLWTPLRKWTSIDSTKIFCVSLLQWTP